MTEWRGEAAPTPSGGFYLPTSGTIGGYVLRLGVLRGVPLDLAIPWQPIWIGLLANWAIWSLVVAAFAIAFYAIRDAIRRRRRLCIECRYDLRASESGRCPECGTLQVRSRGELEPQAASNASLN